MMNKRLLQVLILWGLALAGLALTMALPGLVQAQEPSGEIEAAAASVDFKKTPDSQNALAGSDVVFIFSLQNNGTDNLTLANIQDPYCPPIVFSDPNGNNILNIGETWTASCTVANATVSFTNVATVTINPTAGSPFTAADSAVVNVVDASISLNKTPTSQIVNSGQDAEFDIVIQNTGSVTLTNIVVSDPKAPDCNDSFASLAPGASVTINNCNANNVTESLVNVASVTAVPEAPFNDLEVSDSDSAQVLLSETVALCPINGTVDMIAYWKLDEAGGPIYDDFYGGHDSTSCSGGNCPTSFAQGRVDGAQTFSSALNTGINIDIPNNTPFNWGPTDSFSFEAWVKGVPGVTCNGAATEVVIGRDDSPTSSLHWWLGCDRATDRARFRVDDVSGTTFSDIQGGPSITDGQWHHLVGVRNGSTNKNLLYVDGAQVATEDKIYAAGFGSADAGINLGYLDRAVSSNRFRYNGVIDEVAVYKGALPSSLVTAHYNNGQGKYSPDFCTLNYRPTILSNPVLFGTTEAPYTYQVNAIGQPAPSYSVSVDPTATGFNLNTSTGLITWDPDTIDTYTVTVTATNSEGDDDQIYTLEISDFLRSYLPVVIKNAN